MHLIGYLLMIYLYLSIYHTYARSNLNYWPYSDRRKQSNDIKGIFFEGALVYVIPEGTHALLLADRTSS